MTRCRCDLCSEVLPRDPALELPLWLVRAMDVALLVVVLAVIAGILAGVVGGPK